MEKILSAVVQLAIFSMFIASIIEVIKGVSAVGFWGIVKGLWQALWGNIPLSGEAFPVLNFAIALLCCWAFNVTIMAYVFAGVVADHAPGSSWQQLAAHWIDYFGTASVTYMGSDQLFKRLISVERQARAFAAEVKAP